MEIIKHGNKYKERELVCEKCGCKFIYDLEKDTYFTEETIFTEKPIDCIMFYVDCPECCNSIRIGY